MKYNIAIENYKGDTDPSYLIPALGSSFKENERLKDTVRLLENWQYKSALRQLDKLIQNGTELIDSLLLKGEILALFDDNSGAADVFKAVLLRDEDNAPALVMLLIQLIIMDKQDELQHFYEKLNIIAPQIYSKFLETLYFIEKHKAKTDFEKLNESIDLLCVYGNFIHADGTIPLKLKERLDKVRVLAELYPDALILLSGGAVQNTYTESIEMKKYLMSFDVKKERLITLEKARDTVGNVIEFTDFISPRHFSDICVVSSIEHLPRAWMSLYMGLREINYSANLFGAAPDKEVNREIFEKEMHLSYQTVFRIAGLFEKRDIEAQL